MISIKNVSKNFGSFQALKKVSFDIEAGEIVGFVGQNGAGKTTLMRILTSYYRASFGTVLIDGEDISQNSLAIRKKIGYLPETPPLYLDMTVKAYLNFAAEIKGVAANIRQRQVHRALEECQLGDAFDKTIGTLSKGYKQRVGIAQAIIHEPEILILDEPTSGLDPIQNLQLRNLIRGLKDQRTVILSTHVLSEIEQIAQRVLIIKAGQLIVDELLDVLLKDHKLDKVAPTTLEDVFVHYHQEEPKAVQHG
ncbi:MAG: ABC-2 type transport system ATP-binding protein [Pseudoalteromonas tetraodonis]|jgi:ABC-2 type transport system ATP-binding protein